VEGDSRGGGSGGDPDGVGEERGWDLGGELRDGAGALCPWLDAEPAEAVAERRGGGVSVGVVGGREQPAGGQPVGEAAAATVGRQRARVAKGSGRTIWWVWEVDSDLVADDEVVDGEDDDPGQGLRVEHHERTGDPVVGVEAVVGDEPACVFPAQLHVGRVGRRAGGSARGDACG
jgi:hypothetical protein